jgi:hypothetical protein
MAIDYLRIYDEEISHTRVTAATRRRGKPKKKQANHLTRRHARAGMAKAQSRLPQQRRTPLRSASEENVAMRKQSKKQRAASLRNLKKARRAQKKKKKNPVVISGKNLKVKRVRKGYRASAAKKKTPRKAKSARMPAKRAKAKKKKSSSRKAKGGRLTKRQLAARKGVRTRKRNAEMRSAAGRKAAKSRAKPYRKGGRKAKARAAKSRSTRASRRADLHKHLTPEEREKYGASAYESRRKRRKSKRSRNPIPNPIPLEGGLDFFSGLFAVTLGYLFAAGADRLGATHALTAGSTATTSTTTPATGNFTDSPAVGQIYNSESPALPIWSQPIRLAYTGLAIAAPLGLSAFIKGKGPKSFFQLMAFAAIARTVGKAAEDGLSMALASTSFGNMIYAPEIAAQAKLTSATTTALPSAAAGTFAGLPRANGGLLTGHPVGQPGAQRVSGTPQHVAPALPPQSPFQGAPQMQRQVAAAPPPLPMDQPYVSGPAFNPWAVSE